MVPGADRGDRRHRAACSSPRTLAALTRDELRGLKRMGFSDRRLAYLLKAGEDEVRARRHELGVRPVYKRVDTCAAEFSTRTAYMYSTYEDECEAEPTDRRKIMVLGGGPNRIGQGIEFDYCCVHAALALREDGYETIMVNCNPETVSTDYDTSDRLYFEPLTLEDVLEIVAPGEAARRHRPVRRPDAAEAGARPRAHGVPIIGTSPDMIDWPRTASASSSCCTGSGSSSRPTGPRAPRPTRSPRPRRSATRWWCGRPTCWAAARWRSCTSSATSNATCARRSRSRTIRRCCSTASSTTRSRSTSTRSATAARW